MINNYLMGEGFHKLIFLCYVCYYLLYGFKICMQLMYNLLLVSNLITCQLNIFVFTLHDFIPCFLAKKYVCYYCKLMKSNVYKNILKQLGSWSLQFWIGQLVVFLITPKP